MISTNEGFQFRGGIVGPTQEEKKSTVLQWREGGCLAVYDPSFSPESRVDVIRKKFQENLDCALRT